MNRVSVDTAGRPPSVDALARELSLRHSLPHALLVDFARRAIANSATNKKSSAAELADQLAIEFSQSLLRDVINATGVSETEVDCHAAALLFCPPIRVGAS